MYDYLKGQLVSICPTYLVVEVSGIGYQLVVANPYRWQEEMQHEVQVTVQQVVREDSLTLYGFKDRQEKSLFQKLNKVSGIGPKSAMAILAADDHDGLVQAIDQSDQKYLMKFPGVGKKTASQMILDLQGELNFELEDGPTVDQQSAVDATIIEDAVEALLGLGYSKREVNRIEQPLKEAQVTTTQEALSLAFKLLIN